MNINQLLRGIQNSLSKNNKIHSYFSGTASILTLHRVDHNIQSSLNSSLVVSSNFLEHFIKRAILNGYSFISIDTLHKILKDNVKSTKNLVITLDDGYVDNLNIAYPIFKKYKIPFTIYINSGFIEKKIYPWWYSLEQFLLSNNYFSFDGKLYNIETFSQKQVAFDTLRYKLLRVNQDDFHHFLTKNFPLLPENKNIQPLSWEQIRQLNKDELCTIGCHTYSHRSLKKMSTIEMKNDILQGRELIKEKTNIETYHFAYPYGSSNEAGQREFKIIKDLNYRTGVTTNGGNIFKNHKGKLTALPRIHFFEGIETSHFGKPRLSFL